MKIYDISQELFSSVVFPGDPKPEKEILLNMENDDVCNLTYLKMCAHNGTHMDSPRHFIPDGKAIDEIPLEKVVGMCSVISFDGILGAKDAKNLLDGKQKKILWKGRTVISEEAAHVFKDYGLELIGVESQTVGPESAPANVHKILLGSEAVVLEGLRLGEVPDGDYFLCAQPINLAGCDGAPCRAVLVEK